MHTQTKELNKIPLGSGNFYVVEWDGKTIPTDEELETEKNMIGRTKNGVSVNYTAEYYTAESDDGKAKKTKLIKESVEIDYGVITWNGKTLEKIVSTARVSEENDKRTVKIGGIENYNGKKYVLRFVNVDPADGNIRFTAVGTNSGGWTAAFTPNSETTLRPVFKCEPLDDEGTLVIYDEEVIEATASEATTTSESEPETTET